MSEHYDRKIAIKYNDTRLKEFCGICGEITHPEIPLDLFMNDCMKPVCARCGMKYAPELVRILARYYEELENR
jgi:hypothetical protein